MEVSKGAIALSIASFALIPTIGYVFAQGQSSQVQAQLVSSMDKLDETMVKLNNTVNTISLDVGKMEVRLSRAESDIEELKR